MQAKVNSQKNSAKQDAPASDSDEEQAYDDEEDLEDLDSLPDDEDLSESDEAPAQQHNKKPVAAAAVKASATIPMDSSDSEADDLDDDSGELQPVADDSDDDSEELDLETLRKKAMQEK